MSRRRKIAVLKFNGPRFEDHGLDVDVLSEIVAYKRILQETAKELWRRKHPQRRRIPKNFDADISLKFFKIEPGSTGVPLERSLTAAPIPRLPFDDELDEAATLLEQAIRAAEHAEILPSALPRSVVPMFESFGQALREDEYLLISAGSEGAAARYDRNVQERILRRVSTTHTDAIELVGEVRGTELDGSKFTLRLDDGRKIPGRFAPEQEALVLQALGEHSTTRLHVIGVGEFTTDDGALKQIVRIDRLELIGPAPATEGVAPIWEQLAAIASRVPADAWRQVPSDLATNLDDYLNGTKDTH